MALTDFSIRNPVLANLIMICVFVIGFFSYRMLPRSLMSDIEFNWVFVATVYPGVAPIDVERFVTVPLEDEIKTVDDIEIVTSTSSEGMSFISVKFDINLNKYDFSKLVQDLQQAVDKVRLPDGCEDPNIEVLNASTMMPICSVYLRGDLPELKMKQLIEDIEDDIRNLPGVGDVNLVGVREREIWVEVDPDKLDKYQLTFSQVIAAINTQNRSVPGGTFISGRQEYLLRTMNEFVKPSDIGQVIVRSTQNRVTRVKDVAAVTDTFEKRKTISRAEGELAMSISIIKKDKGDSVSIVEAIEQLLVDYRASRLPPGVTLSLFNDNSEPIVDGLRKLQNNAMMGMFLVTLTLYVFMGWRNAMFAALGIPVTFFVAFIAMQYLGESLNGSSLFALVLVLGMIVDDAVVIIDNCYRYLQRGFSAHDSALYGCKEVIVPVISSSFTTIGAFLPLMFLPGIVGKFMKVIPVVFCIVLLASLFDALVILPSHIADWSKFKPINPKNFIYRFHLKIKRRYTKLLIKVLRHRYIAVAVVLVLLVFSGFMIPLLGVDMFADEEVPFLMVQVKTRVGTKLSATDEIIRQVEEVALTLPREEVVNIVARSGIMETRDEVIRDSAIGEVVIELVKDTKRERSIDEVKEELRQKLKKISGITSLNFEVPMSGPPVGAPVEIKVQGRYLNELFEVKEVVKKELAKIDGVVDIRDDWQEGKMELQVEVEPQAALNAGLDPGQIAWTVRQAFEGEVATVFKDADEEVDVLVKLASGSGDKMSHLYNLKLTNRWGKRIALKEVASVKFEPGYAQIERFDFKRTITVSANVDGAIITGIEANQLLQKRLKFIPQRFPGNNIDFRGEFDEFKKSFDNLIRLFLIGVFIIFMILGAQFHSFIQPLIILFTIPFGFIGAVVGLLIINAPFSIMAMYAIVALTGIVVNNAIVLIDFTNRYRIEERGRWKSIIDAGRVRLRPIFLTSLTTILGLLPMGLGIGGKSPVWGPMANTIIFGLLVSTVLTLFIIPSLYAIVDDIRKRDA